MAVAAVDTIICDVMFVTKRDRLGARNSYFRDIGGAIQRHQHQCQRDDEPDPAEYADPGDRVRARMKNLRHSAGAPTTVRCVTSVARGYFLR